MSGAQTRALLSDALDSIRAIQDFLSGVDLAGYRADDMLRAAVERHFIIVGEALGTLRRSDPATAAMIPMLADAVRFRHVLVHGYAVVTDERVWATATEHLPTLRARVAEILEALGDGRG